MSTPAHAMRALLLVRWPLTAGGDAARQADAVHALARHLLAQHAEAFSGADAVRALDGSRLYLQLACSTPGEPSPALRDAVQQAARAAALPGAGTAAATRLAPQQDQPGASAGEPAPFHYAVELDIAGEHAQSMRDWYETEHLPALAAVPGNVRARRYTDLDGLPRSFACYDLVSPDVLQSPAWLAVRATDWSSRIRPLFQNVHRTVFERLFSLEPAPHA